MKSIKLISNRQLDWDMYASMEELLEAVKPLKTIALDIETKGFNPYKHRITAVQIGVGDTAYVVDTEGMDLSVFKFLESKICVGHNIKFDIVFLMVQAGIFITKVYDTYIAELAMTNGLLNQRRDLGSVTKKYTGIKLNKAQQDNIHIMELHTRQNIEYSGNDVLYLLETAKKQILRVKADGFEALVKEEMSALPAFAYMQHSGFTVDVDKWRSTYRYFSSQAGEYRRQLDLEIIEAVPELLNTQGDLFSTETKSRLNWDAPQQAKSAFVKAGILMEGDSIVKGELKKIDNPIVDTYIKFKVARKYESTYGEAFLRHIQDDGRIHPDIKQMVDTGRTSCKPNLQNIPKKEQFRQPFIAGEGNKLIVCDYSGQESVILADHSRDSKLLEFYQSGEADLHSYVARLIWKDEIGHLSLAEIDAEHPDKRQKAKSANFAIVYGGNGGTIANNLNISKSEGDRIYSSFMSVFGGMNEYFDFKYREALELGYILINPKSGRRRYFDFFDEFIRLHKIITSGGFWSEFNDERRKGTNRYFRELLPMRERYYNWEHVVRKAAMNTPIQGTAADQKKRALALFFRWIIKNDLIDIVKTPIEVHDEIVAECPHHLAETVAEQLQKAMEDAGNHYLDILTIKAKPVILDCWWEKK